MQYKASFKCVAATRDQMIKVKIIAQMYASEIVKVINEDNLEVRITHSESR